MTATTPTPTTEQQGRSRPAGALPAALLGVTLPVLGWLALVPVGGVPLVVDTGNGRRSVSLVATTVAALVASLGAIVLAAVARRTGRPRLVLLGGAVAVFLTSLVGPMAAPTAGAGLGLGALHLLTAVGVVPVLAARLPRRR